MIQMPTLKLVYYVGVVQYDITTMVQEVKWSGDIETVFRKLEIDVANSDPTKKDEEMAIGFETGRPLFFYVDGKEVFRGVIFDTDFKSDGTASITAFDEAKYLTLNEDTRFCIKTTAGSFLKTLFKDYDIAIGSIADTKYVIDKMIFRGETIWSIAQKVLTKTRDETGRRYWLYCENGLVNLVERKDQTVRWVLEEKINILDSSRKVNIEELRNHIKVTSGTVDDKSPKLPTSVVAKDDTSIARYGKMSMVDDMDEKAAKARLNERAARLLKEKNRPKIDIDVTALGIVDVYSGKGVLVYDKRTRINGGYYVQEDTHTWDTKGNYTMDLTLSATDELPFVDLGQDDEAQAAPKYQTDLSPTGYGGPGVSYYDPSVGVWK